MRNERHGWYKTHTAVWLKFYMYNFLHKGLIYLNDSCPWTCPDLASKDCCWRGRWKWSVQKEKSPRPQEGAPHAPIPRVRWRAREEMCDSSVPLSIPLFLSICLSLWSYHAVGSFLSLRGASSFPSSCLCLLFLHRLQEKMMMRSKTTAAMPPPMANARRRSSEKEAVGETETQAECPKTSLLRAMLWCVPAVVINTLFL